MANEGGGKKIIEIPVETQQWDAFVSSFHDWQNELEKTNGAWSDASKGVSKLETAFDKVDASFNDLVKHATNPKFSNPTSGVFTRVKKESVETEKSWRNISREIERAGKGMGNLARSGLGIGALGVFGGAGALFAGVRGADNSLADQNILNRKLGLKPGEETAFDNVYGPAGGNSALLGNVAAAQGDPQQWRYLQAAGISQQDIQSKDAAELSAQLLKNVGDRVNQVGLPQTGLWLHALGIDKFVDTNNARLAGSYADQFGSMHDKYLKAIPGYAQDQKTLDEGTAAKQAFDAAWQKDLVEFDKVLVRLNPGFIKLAGEVTDMVKAFADSGELQHDIDEVSEAFKDVAATLKQLGIINDNPANDAVGTGMDATKKSAWETGNWLEKEFPGYKAWRERNSDWLGPDSDGGVGTGTLDDKGRATSDQILDAIRQNESSGKAGAVNPASGAAGLYGLMPDNAKGINVDDPIASRKAARKVLDDQLRAFNGDQAKALAGYDGDTHVAADSKKYGDMWLKGAKQETIDYLRKIENQGLDIGLTADQQAYIDAHTSVKAAHAAAAHPQAKAFESGTKDDPLRNAPKIVPFTDDDARAKADSDKNNQPLMSESLVERLTRGLGMMGKSISEGGGSQFRMPDQPARPAGNTAMAPYNINVTVTSPAGSSTTVTAGGLAQ
ncbi:hypothetical protein R69608_01415 [Paraburkholderia nemoris]|uniref:lytic transglycosylase domain-containing protein n=1 Tax=Paraburkholderia nemoris TaxID=2793076 RepID=UPI0019142182|nr:lytic transglycosylase domain-containing protein [Paraburkholderia nemoris]MBK5148039.1 lytic transglycosylase domain-containing protein [Burkholderia sp. R-69608]CAE6876121.1 hypothetical protein R69608_01415 [Paraburkholderia nemoris]